MTAKQVALERLGYTVPVSGAGAVVTAVQKHSPAAGKVRVGDVITAVDGQPVMFAEQLGPMVRTRPPAIPSVMVSVDRGPWRRGIRRR